MVRLESVGGNANCIRVRHQTMAMFQIGLDFAQSLTIGFT
jgi:hypothetical protein